MNEGRAQGYREEFVEKQKDRHRGALIGLAVGDALGGTLEFCRRDTKPELTDMIGGGPHDLEPGQWTDDTSMALALGDSLVTQGGMDPEDQMRRYLAWSNKGHYSCKGYCFDIGIQTSRALQQFQDTGDPCQGEPDSDRAGNGSLMRLAPVPMVYWDYPVVLTTMSVRSSETTHGDRRCEDACVVMAEVMAFCFRRGDLPTSLSGALRSAVNGMRLHPEIRAIVDGSYKTKVRDQIKSTGYVVHTLEAAFWAVHNTDNFKDAVLLAANLGDDADTVGAVTGQLAGALYGASDIPERWVRLLAWEEDISALAANLWLLSTGQGTDSTSYCLSTKEV